MLIDLHMSNQYCIPGKRRIVGELFDVLRDSVGQYFIEDFCINVRHGYWPVAFFCSCVSARFCYQDDTALIK